MLFNFLNHFSFVLFVPLLAFFYRRVHSSRFFGERERWVVGKGYKPEENAEEVEASKVETHQKQCPLWGENVKLVKKKTHNNK